MSPASISDMTGIVDELMCEVNRLSIAERKRKERELKIAVERDRVQKLSELLDELEDTPEVALCRKKIVDMARGIECWIRRGTFPMEKFSR